MLRTTAGPSGTMAKYNHYGLQEPVHEGTVRQPQEKDRQEELYKGTHFHYI
jgi:hypothetical protein